MNTLYNDCTIETRCTYICEKATGPKILPISELLLKKA